MALDGRRADEAVAPDERVAADLARVLGPGHPETFAIRRTPDIVRRGRSERETSDAGPSAPA
ncbi:hypothetical protein OG618_10220 [Kitasatospora sp. NBC_01246]|uniref:hypothetical protein n=1 Tax=Kitasatospora sp. NBC_01246 TaxID=2903570 RepID=UPI002E2F196A|nr:hypothetical protein [Kitasatospora sp. NBC_01246]